MYAMLHIHFTHQLKCVRQRERYRERDCKVVRGRWKIEKKEERWREKKDSERRKKERETESGDEEGARERER